MSSGYANGQFLITAEELEGAVSGTLVILDARPRAEYELGHIPGAVSLPTSEMEHTVRLPGGALARMIAVPVAELGRRFRAAGVSGDRAVVVYDRGGDARAARLWWMLDYAGHPLPRYLDGGVAAWQARGGPIALHEPTVASGTFTPSPVDGRLARYEEVAVRHNEAALCHTLAPHAFAAAAIPGSCNLPFDQAFAPGAPPRLRGAEELAGLLAGRALHPEREVIFYCGAGYTASLWYLGARLLGYRRARMYDGSLEEWRARGGPLEAS